MKEYKKILKHVKLWVKEVGTIQLERLAQKNHVIERKSTEFDLVTEVDKLSEEILIAKIREVYPGHSILSEESGSLEKESDYQWVIDPLDGTTNYAHGFPIFCISIALKYQQQTMLGVVYVPALNEMFWALKNDGAYLNGVRLKVSDATELRQALLVTGFPYDKAIDPANNVNYFEQLVTQIGGIRRTGSAAFDLCNVAAGWFDGYWELKLKPWDMAAGALMVEEAGGRIIYLKEEKPISLIAANSILGEKILAELTKVR